MKKYHKPLSLLLLHLWRQYSSHVVPVEAFSCGQIHHYRRKRHQNNRVTTSTTCSQQYTSCTPINYSFISTSKSSSSLCNNNNNNIEVSIINSNHDILSLADMRYQEWMTNDPNPPSIRNFRLATIDICQERKMDGAMVFLAKRTDNDTASNNNCGGITLVGAAELSPIELKDVIVLTDCSTMEQQQQQQQQLNSNLLQYVTDVVTSSTSRRLGVGSILMNAIEKSAWDMGTRCLLLHVEADNDMALRFYEKLNYVHVGQEDETTKPFGVDSIIGGVVSLNLESSVGRMIPIDTNRLALNAGTTGQLLLMKELSSEPPVGLLRGEEEERAITDAASRDVGKGFGMMSVTGKKKKKTTR